MCRIYACDYRRGIDDGDGATQRDRVNACGGGGGCLCVVCVHDGVGFVFFFGAPTERVFLVLCVNEGRALRFVALKLLVGWL